MVQMTRKQVYIRQDQDERLKGLASDRNASESELIREAIDRFLAEDSEGKGLARWLRHLEWAKMRAASLPGGTGGERGWTREDLYRRGTDK